MKTVIMYDGADPDADSLLESLKPFCEGNGNTLDTIDASTIRLSDCVGCFNCWIKTPGLCIFTKDQGHDMLRTILSGDRLLILSRITWGGYSLPVKTCADRTLTMLLPFFKKFNGEMHHKLRYTSTPLFLMAGFGALTTEEEATFKEYTLAHRDNISIDRPNGTLIISKEIQPGSNEAAKKLKEWFIKEAV